MLVRPGPDRTEFTLDFSPELLVAFLTLFVLEVVLGVDNVIFISILASKLPVEQQTKARNLGLSRRERQVRGSSSLTYEWTPWSRVCAPDLAEASTR